MKTKKVNKRLTLRKETIADLEPKAMEAVMGGTGPTGGTDETVEDCDPKIPTNACK